ncbi:MAG TPA: hypothetical protein VIL46_18830 [Gemmataceae bacterium]
MRFFLRPLFYLWALPGTAVGLLCLPLALLSGGGVRVVRGALEVHGGLVAFLLRRLVPIAGGASAMTLGHVILGCDRESLDRCREHEHVHVRQFERWGPFMIPLYLIASGVALIRGRDPYRDNPFEREAYERG